MTYFTPRFEEIVSMGLGRMIASLKVFYKTRRFIAKTTQTIALKISSD